MRTPKTNHRQFSRLFRAGAIGCLVAAVAPFAVPHAAQAAPKAGSGASKAGRTLDIAVSISDLADPVRLGDEVTYRAVVSNVGTTTATDLRVPVRVYYRNLDHTRFVVYSSVTPSKESCSMVRYGDVSIVSYRDERDLPLPSTSYVGLQVGLGVGAGHGSMPICNIGTLAPGETASIDVVVRPMYPSRYSPNYAGEYPTLVASVHHSLHAYSLDAQDSNSANDSDEETTIVTTGTDMGDCVLTGVGVLFQSTTCYRGPQS